MRTPHIVLRLLAVISFLLAGFVGLTETASATSVKTPAAIASAAHLNAGCVAQVMNELPASTSASDIAQASAFGCSIGVMKVEHHPATKLLVKSDASCPCDSWYYAGSTSVNYSTTGWEVKNAWDYEQDTFVSGARQSGTPRCTVPWVAGGSITLHGPCVFVGADPALRGAGTTFGMESDYTVSWVYKGSPFSADYWLRGAMDGYATTYSDNG